MAKDYKNYLKNQDQRRKNGDIRRIVNGHPTTFWSKPTRFEKPAEIPIETVDTLEAVPVSEPQSKTAPQ